VGFLPALVALIHEGALFRYPKTCDGWAGRSYLQNRGEDHAVA